MSSNATPSDSQAYQRAKHLALLASLGIALAGLIAAALFGPAVDSVIRSVFGDNRWVRLIATGFLYAAAFELLSLPIDFWSGFILEHRYGLSNQRLSSWWWKQVKGWLLAGPLGLILLLGLYAFLWFAGDWWWLAAAAGWLLLTVVLARILPVLILPLFYKVTPLDDGGLLTRLRLLADGTGLAIEGVYRLHLSEETKKANAALAGLGRSRRVLLGDTLLAEFAPEEIEVVFAHEVGHHVHRHLVKLIAIHTALTTLSLWLADHVLAHAAVALGYRSATDPAALPLLLLVLGLFGLLVLPAKNALSRWFERQCDRYALARTANPAAYRSAFEKLGRLNKADADPHPFLVWLLHDHPTIPERIAAGAAKTILS